MSAADKSARCYLLQQPGATHPLQPEQFEIDYWRDQPGSEPLAAGRGGSLRIVIDEQQAILRRYYRGGAVGRFLHDQYLWLGKSLSRPWREWAVLQRARAAGLPVPEPIGACVCRSGLSYRAALITAYLEDTETLTHRLRREALGRDHWYQLGLLIKRLQAEGIRHADLTSDNILIDSAERFYLIDFDRARIMSRMDDWQWRPLYRFQRSMIKRNRQQRLHFDEDDWQALMDGYES